MVDPKVSSLVFVPIEGLVLEAIVRLLSQGGYIPHPDSAHSGEIHLPVIVSLEVVGVE